MFEHSPEAGGKCTILWRRRAVFRCAGQSHCRKKSGEYTLRGSSRGFACAESDGPRFRLEQQWKTCGIVTAGTTDSRILIGAHELSTWEWICCQREQHNLGVALGASRLRLSPSACASVLPVLPL